MKAVVSFFVLIFMAACAPKTRIETKEEYNKFKNQYICRSVQNYLQNINKGTLEVNFYKETDQDKNTTSFKMILATQNNRFFNFPTTSHVILTFDAHERIKIRGTSANDKYTSSHYAPGYFSYGVYHPGSMSINNLYVGALVIDANEELIEKIADAQSLTLEIEGVADELKASFSKENFLAVKNFMNRCMN